MDTNDVCIVVAVATMGLSVKPVPLHGRKRRSL